MSSLSGFRTKFEGFFNFPKLFRFLAFVNTTWNVRSTRKLVEVTTSSAKLTSFFFFSLLSKSYDDVLTAEHVFAFHAMQQHSNYKTGDCTSVPFKRKFPASDIANKSSFRSLTPFMQWELTL
jgi:hypothetical protein